MDSIAIVAHTLTVQRVFATLAAALALTAYLFPEPSPEAVHMETFDFVIVGGGSAGCVLADRLSERGHYSVLLLEAGADPPIESLMPGLFPYLPRTSYDFNLTSENDHFTYQSHKIGALNLTAGRVLGGGSSVNYMLYVRGCPGDYRRWALAAQDSTWDWPNVLPYFIRSEKLMSSEILSTTYKKYHGTKGFLKVTRENRTEINKYLNSFQEVGKPLLFDINGPSSIGYTPQLLNIADGLRQSTAVTNLANKRRHNLIIRKETSVTKIIIDDHNVARGVELHDKSIVFARREVILTAGALNSPRLLLLSGVGPREHLQDLGVPVRSNLPVGYNFQDHVMLVTSIKTEESNTPPAPPDTHEFPFPVFSGYVALDESQECPDYQAINLIIPNDSVGPLQLCAFNMGFEDQICQNLFDASKGRKTLYTNLNLLHPRSRGRVLLRSADPTDPPIVHPGTFSDSRDLDDLVSYVMDFAKVLNATYLKNLKAEFADLPKRQCAHFERGSPRYWRCYVLHMTTTIWHYSGTCSLGTVVDSALRVRGVKNLRVADASVIPHIISGNINAAVIMIAEKAADFIIGQHEEPVPHMDSLSFIHKQ